jgi:hypothetical protein
VCVRVCLPIHGPRHHQEHPLLAERIEFRRQLQLRSLRGGGGGGGGGDGAPPPPATPAGTIAPVHVHVGCLLELDELFGFVGIWDGPTRTLSFWGGGGGGGGDEVPFDVTTLGDVGEATAEALFAGRVGDVRVATATVTLRDIAAAMNELGGGSQRPPVTLRCRGSLAALDAAIRAAEPGCGVRCVLFGGRFD